MAGLDPQFPIIIPANEGISLLFNADNEVVAITISKTGCGNFNYAASLIQLESITIDNTQLFVTNTIPYGDYYYFEVVPTVLSPTGPSIGIGCTPVIFNPFAQGQSFTYNDYNALLGNSEESRRADLIYEVDYTSAVSGSIVPSNLIAILSGSAVRAEVQQSNYESFGFTSGRYTGAKTSITDYGVSSAIAGTPFEAALYLSSSAANLICSQSLTDRKVAEYIFTGNEEFPIIGSRLFSFEGNKIIPVRNRKVWVRSTEEVLLSDNDGFVTEIVITCST